MPFAEDPASLSLTHHTFLVGPWADAGDGAVLVTEVDDESCVVLILKPGDVAPLVEALRAASDPPFATPATGDKP